MRPIGRERVDVSAQRGRSVITTIALLYVFLLWSPYGIGQTIIFLPCGFLYLSSIFFPRLISAVADWMFAILPHMAWP